MLSRKLAFGTVVPVLVRVDIAPRCTCRQTLHKVRAAQTPPPPPSRDDEFETGNGSNTDWDRSWAEFRTSTQKGSAYGVVEPEASTRNTPPPPNDYATETKLADIWTSDKAFLAAALVLGLVAVFYAFVLFNPGS